MFYFVVIIYRLFTVQILQHDEYTDKYLNQKQNKVIINAPRGKIYDRNYTLLAESPGFTYSFGINLRKVSNKLDLAKRLANITGEKFLDIVNIMEKNKGFTWLCHGLYTNEKKLILKSLTNEESYAASFKVLPQRIYPQNRVAGQILGYVNRDGQGIAGLEKRYDDYLKGTPGYEYIFKDARNNISYGNTAKQKEAIPGKNIVLTINSQYQAICENEIKKSVQKWKAKKGVVVLTNPHNGEIIAMASYPDYNPNIPGEFDAFARKSKAVTDAYEPGSTFKSLTASILFEEGIVKESSVFFCDNKGYKILKNKAPIRDSHKHENEYLTFTQVIAKSSNIGTVKATEGLDPRKFYSYIRSFGFGDKTDVEITGETRGIVPNHVTWNKLTLPNISFGQGISVTPLQLTMAYGVLANGGNLFKPQLVKGILDNNGEIILNNNPVLKRRVISKESAERIRNILKRVVMPGGTAENVNSDIVRIAGKTGTSQKVVNGRYSQREHDASFAGFFPADNPEYVCLVMLDNPKPLYWGGTVAGPVFKNIAEKITEIEKKTIQVTENETPAKEIAPALKGLSIEEATKICLTKGIDLDISGEGDKIISQTPKPFSVLNKRKKIKVYFSNYNESTEIPNVVDKSLRDAVKELHRNNVPVYVKGFGIVKKQSGVQILEKETFSPCTLYCEDLVDEKKIRNSFFAEL